MRRRVLILLGVIALATAIFIAYILLKPHKVTSPSLQTQTLEEVTQPSIPEKPALVDVQPIIDTWAAKQTGDYSVVVYDLENDQTIGAVNQDQIYFAASIYKLYVAYEGYLAAQRGDYDLQEIYLNGQSRGECLFKMIHESDSPCAEKLWVELGKSELTAKLETYGIKNTSMTAINTTAQDAALQLIRLWNNDELNEANKATMLKSMATQIYRDSLAKGFSSVTFYDKVGFNGFEEYHDVGILELPNGRHYVVSVLTSEVGTAAMTELGTKLLAALTDESTTE